MSRDNRKFRKPIWVKLAMALLVVTGGLTMTACQNVKIGGHSIGKPKKEQPAKSDSKNPNEPVKKDQSTESDPKNPDQKPKDGQDTQVDDDPE